MSFAVDVHPIYPRDVSISSRITLRSTYNSTATDLGDITTLNDAFTGTPTDVVEAVNSKSTQGFSIAMAVALG